MPGDSTTDQLAQRLRGRAPRPLLSRSAEERLGQRHREILDELEAMFRADGFSAFTIRELAAGVGCSRRTLYEIAASKDQLVLVVLDRLLHRAGRHALETIDVVDADLGVLDQLRRYLGGDIGLHFQASLYDDLADEPAARRLLDRHFRYVMTVIEELVRLGVERGEVRPVDPAVVAATIAGASLYLSQPEVAEQVMTDAERRPVHEMLDLILPGLAADAGVAVPSSRS
ncbi:MAG: TetR/AcrR family transcriptional regulator [Acidimicrobiales bacterium]